MSMKVHNAELYVETMQSADWSLTEAQRRAREAQEEESSGGAGGRQLFSGSRKRGNNTNGGAFSSSSQSGGGALSTDALAGKRAVLEAEFRAKMDLAKRESDRRSHEKAMRQERQFEEKYAAFVAKNKEVVAQSKASGEASALRERKRERLYQEWMQKVFLPMQGEINSKIEAAETADIIAFRNQQYQAYLDECERSRKNGGGVYLDVITETQYNPFIANAATTVKYNNASIADDPLKNRVTRESKLASESGNANSNNATGMSGEDGGENISTRAKGMSERFAMSSGTWAQSQAHANRFALLPSEALGTNVNTDVANDSSHNNPFASFGGGAGGASSSTQHHLPKIRSVGGVSVQITNPDVIKSKMNTMSTTGASRAYISPSAAALEPKHKYSANNSLFNCTKEAIPVRGALVDPKQWSRMEATPHGRFSDDNVGPTGRPRVPQPGTKVGFNKSDVVFDHYTMPKGDEGAKQVRKELGTERGKRCGYAGTANASESPLF